VAVIDTGVDKTHPDLAGRVIAGWNFVNNSSNTSDTTGHGTAVARTIGAVTNNGFGVAGGAWQNPIMPLVAVDANDYASYSNIIAAIQYAVDHGAKVINASLGGTTPSSAMQSAVDYAWNHNAIVIAAALNNSSTTPVYPAACSHAVAVSATDENDALASFSDFGNWITIAAPGNNILTTSKGGGYQYWWGTSLATPVVASVAALALAANPSMSSQTLLTLLEQNADDLGPSGYDSSFGYGRVNAYRTVAAARALAAPAPAPAPAPTPAPAPSPSPSPSPSPTASLPIRINAGGSGFVDSAGHTWQADNAFSGGATWSVVNSISNAGAPALYQTCRYGEFSYNENVPNGAYAVNLKFAEISMNGPGQRVFSVAINGSTVLNNFDIYAQAGGKFIALDKSFPVNVTGGRITVQFTDGSANSPLVSAIEILQGSSASAAGAIRVNAGGSSYTDSSGNVWSADTGFSGGLIWSVASAISGTSASSIYQTCRYGQLSYSFNVPDGDYTVNLKFAEVSMTGPGQRVFNVMVNGSTVLSNFDVYAAAGGRLRAIDKAFPVSVTGGMIWIQFLTGSANSPMVNAIEITPGARSSALPSTRINAGGAGFTDVSGSVWSADTNYAGGQTWSVGSGISNTAASTLYQTCRYGNFSYTVAVPNGNYTVNLKFAEVSMTGPGQRMFNVNINGDRALSNFDIYAAAGGALRAIDKPFTVSVTGGTITIQFFAGDANLPMVNAIEIAPAP
ncbi:MAG TPA: malectin domain-containing carbohydrate-binding protein, partial [Bryobacteraceae bacterium]